LKKTSLGGPLGVPPVGPVVASTEVVDGVIADYVDGGAPGRRC
jgi:hypothetical protein